MAKKIAVLFDSTVVRKEALHYSVELAKRTEASLHLLIILPIMVSEKNGMVQNGTSERESKALEALRSVMDELGDTGLSVDMGARSGEPFSEMMKYLAEQGPFQAVVWGGDRGLLEEKARRNRSHWLLKVRDMLGCPLVVPSKRPFRVTGA